MLPFSQTDTPPFAPLQKEFFMDEHIVRCCEGVEAAMRGVYQPTQTMVWQQHPQCQCASYISNHICLSRCSKLPLTLATLSLCC